MDSAALSSARAFYAVTACINICTWSMLPLASYLRYPVVTRPSWLPARVLRALCSRPVYLALCRGSPAVLLCAAARPDAALLRLLAAAWHTCYQLAESRQAPTLTLDIVMLILGGFLSVKLWTLRNAESEYEEPLAKGAKQPPSYGTAAP